MKISQRMIESSNKRIQICGPDDEQTVSFSAKLTTNFDIFRLSKNELAELVDISIDIQSASS